MIVESVRCQEVEAAAFSADSIVLSSLVGTLAECVPTDFTFSILKNAAKFFYDDLPGLHYFPGVKQ